VLVNVTVVNPSSPGFLALRPAGASGAPATSTVNFPSAGAIVPNSATVALGAGGKIQIWLETAADSGTADVLVDVVGYTVGHHHDDRYYTEPEVDSRIAAVDAAVDGLTTSAGQNGGMLLTEIDHVAIAVRDLEAAIDYYQRAFGAR
jgi:hypothetical protein